LLLSALCNYLAFIVSSGQPDVNVVTAMEKFTENLHIRLRHPAYDLKNNTVAQQFFKQEAA